MIFKFVPDILGQYYIGIEVGLEQADCTGLTLSTMLEIAAREIPGFAEVNARLLERNSGTYHVTVFNVMEYGKGKIHDDIIGSVMYDVTFTGIGSFAYDGKTTYYITVTSPTINDIREGHGFNPKDLHITIGFTHKDLFGKGKGLPNVYEVKQYEI